VTAVKAGAYHFISKPFDVETPVLIVRQALEHKRLLGHARALEQRLRERTAGGEGALLVGAGTAMRRVRQLIEAAAPTSAGVLIRGESGTGKELVARAIHELGPRRRRDFVALNCAALPQGLLEAELFGVVRGAYTGADRSRPGIFVAADGGTIMLDEIGHAPLTVQANLLRVVQEGEVRPVGAERSIDVDVRVIAATHVNLEEAVSAGRFREDLYYRLDVLSIPLPALRERPEDIPALARHFLARAAAKHGRPVPDVQPEAMEALVAWRWPGNVRELENALERAVVLARDQMLGVMDLPDVVIAGTSEGGGSGYREARRRALQTFDRAFVETALARAGGNVSEAARLSGLDRANFRRIMKRGRD
jgi:DNA-binding NtrC family response regulator